MSGNERIQLLGKRLRMERLMRNDTQAAFAARIGTSVPTLRKMEAGNSGVLIGHWVAALKILDREAEWDALLAEPEDLFVKFEQTMAPVRQRARRRSK